MQTDLDSREDQIELHPERPVEAQMGASGCERGEAQENEIRVDAARRGGSTGRRSSPLEVAGPTSHRQEANASRAT